MSFQKETWLSTSVTDATSRRSRQFKDLPILKIITHPVIIPMTWNQIHYQVTKSHLVPENRV